MHCKYVYKEKELMQFLDVTKHLSGVDRSQMLLQLIRYHGEMLVYEICLLACCSCCCMMSPYGSANMGSQCY